MDNPSSKSAADKKAARSSAIEEQIREQQKRKQERAFLEELAKRISIAREGKHHSDRKEFAQALSCYRRFMQITAQAMRVEVAYEPPSQQLPPASLVSPKTPHLLRRACYLLPPLPPSSSPCRRASLSTSH